MELQCQVQKYHWGKNGKTSKVASLAAINDPDVTIDKNEHYAEFWMGTHPNGPSRIKDNGQLLIDYIQDNPDVLGAEGSNIPYLLKVLSVETALSIQAHPNKKHAEELFKKKPDIYKDDNHKPEMALAITEFEGLCGFRPLNEIKNNLKIKCPELGKLVGCEILLEADETNYIGPLKKCFETLMRSDKETLEKTLRRFQCSIKDGDDEDFKLFRRLMEQYPNDVGCFVMFFLNVVTLSPGEAMFLGPNVPHAYLRGDCVECMARSDNTIRAGLTPKFIDVDTLCGMLDYNCVKEKDDVKFVPHIENENSMLYDPPVPDFSVAKIDLMDSSVALVVRKTASILIVTEGEGTCQLEHGLEKKLSAGTVLFLAGGQKINVKKSTDSLVAYQGFF